MKKEAREGTAWVGEGRHRGQRQHWDRGDRGRPAQQSEQNSPELQGGDWEEGIGLPPNGDPSHSPLGPIQGGG